MEPANRQAPTAPTDASRQAPTAPGAPTAKRQPLLDRLALLPGGANRQAPDAPGARRYTRAEAAAALGVSVDSLRRLQSRAGVTGERVAREGGGELVTFAEDDLAALRQAAATRQAPGANRQPPTAPGGEPPSATRQAPGAPTAKRSDDSPAPGPPAVDLLAALRESHAAEVARLECELDRARRELECERVAREEAARRAEEAERGCQAARLQLEALRGAWWRWYALASAPCPWWRRRCLPDPPRELASGPALPPPA